MTDQIKPGDLVRLADGCCPPVRSRINFVGTVSEVRLAAVADHSCGYLGISETVARVPALVDPPYRDDRTFGWFPVAWLRKI